MKKVLNISILSIALLASFSFAFADGLVGTNPPTNSYSVTLPNPLGNTTLTDLITRVINYATGILIAISVLFIIYAAYLFMFSGGDPKNVIQAKNIITYTVVAIVVALLSNLIIGAVLSVIKG